MTTPGGGFYKYHCRYFTTDDCPYWVFINNSTCARCLARGREDELPPAAAWTASRDVMAPHVNDGILQYAHMDIAVSEQGEESLVMRSETLRPPPPAIPVTTMMPGGKTLLATTH
ncbi:hypothetical protein G3M48_009487 [Beauveria asiatica]|uniref:Uncharacterized protein n=1 Tax=Beauveria asiatica TaxID=1069075 RepID=A0AAW0RIY4_9HYPO